METDVSAVQVTATGSAISFPTRVRGLWVAGNGTGASSVIFQDGNGGTTRLSLQAASTPVPAYMAMPHSGVKFSNSVYVSTLTNITSLTIFYG